MEKEGQQTVLSEASFDELIAEIKKRCDKYWKLSRSKKSVKIDPSTWSDND
jgi:hypothetical protein